MLGGVARHLAPPPDLRSAQSERTLGVPPMIGGLDVKDLMAVWGGLLSTGLAGIKVFEWWRDRDRLDISFGSSTSVEHGNQIQIRNLSSRPIIITHWELFLAFDSKGKRDCEFVDSADYDDGDLTISAHASTQWNFCEARYFSTSGKHLRGRSIYLRLCIAGRKDLTKKLYPYS